MPQHFLLTAAAKTLTLASVARMSDEAVETVFRKIRWVSNGGDPFCPKCGCAIVYDCRRANGLARWRCKACRHSFSITSGTLFHSRKMPLRGYLMAIAIFCNEVKGKSMEIDGGYFGGYVKPANRRENRRDRRLRQYRSGKRRVVVVIRERNGRSLPGIFHSEVEALTFIRRQVPWGTELYADEASAWNVLHARYTLHRVNHEEAYSLGGEHEINTNAAESFSPA